MPQIITMDFRSPDPGPLQFVLGDTLLIAGTPGATRSEAYVYRFLVGGAVIEEFWITGISPETGGAPDKQYVISDAILGAAGGATTIEVTVEQRYRDIYLPPETDRVLQTRKLIVAVTDTEIAQAEIAESAATAGIFARFGSFIGLRSVPAVRLTATAPNGSTIARVDLYDGPDGTGERVGGAIYTPGVAQLQNMLIPESQPVQRHGQLSRSLVITDARGRKVKRDFGLVVTKYAPPQIVKLTLRRAEQDGTPSAAGTRVLARVQAEAQSLPVGGVEKNTVGFVFTARQVGGSEDVMRCEIQATGTQIDAEYLLPGSVQCLLERNYAFELVMSDWFSSVTRNGLISTSGAMLSLHRAGMGLAIGKKATEVGIMDVALPAKFGAGATFGGPVLFASDVELAVPLPVASGGTGVRSLDELKGALNVGTAPAILRGSIAFTLAASASGATQTVMFTKPFAIVPTVLIQLQLATTFNVVTYAVSYVNTSYFQFQVTNGNAAQKSCVMHWVAVG